TVGELLEKQHYSPQAINDDFSKKIFTKFINDLDADKCLFIQTDIDALKKYETTLDDEIHGKEELQFLPALNAIYSKRTDEIIVLYKDILSKPFDFNIDEDYAIDGEKIPFPKNEDARKDRLRKKLKYMALDRYVDLLEQREKSVVDSVKNKSNAALEIDARTRVQKAMDKIYTRVKAKFNDDERFNAFVNTIANQMDPHSDFFPPVEKRAFDEMMSGRFFGIGAQLQEQDGNIKIASLMPAYPAQRSGELDVNDLIVKVAQGNDEPVEITGYDITDAVKLIRGKRDTEVKLTVKKADGTTKVVSIIRAEIVQDEAYARSAVYNDANGDKIGYLWLPDFYADFERVNGARCSEDVAVEVKKLKNADVKGIVLDLRYNGGGSLYEVVQMVGLFIPQGPVVQVRDKDGKLTPLPNKNNDVLYDGPLTVMVNEASASASEIFAAAIQDYGRGIIVGSSTYGKGTVQRNVPLSKQIDFMTSAQPDMGFVKLTFQKFYRISGGSTQLKGVTPDIILPDMLDYLKIREKDNSAALSWDEIKKADYTMCKTANINALVVKKMNDAIASNNTFKLLKDNTSWLSKHSDEPKTLQIEKYREYQKKVATTVAQSTSLVKLKKDLNMTVLKEDNDKFYNNTDKQKGERYQSWLKSIKTDIYINESMEVVKSLINASNLASKN
ncbi:MAG: carboxy terminal-processing peptidase, partial [Chitinophagaceae bacterium]